MGLFDRFKKKNEKSDPIEQVAPTQVSPEFYTKPDGSVYGTINMKEGEATILPRDPWATWRYEHKRVEEWQLCLIGVTIPGIVKDMDYREAFMKLMDFRISEGSYNITVRPLTYEEMENL